MQAAVQLYEILETVDRKCEHLRHMNAITDLLYHMKYMFIGDGIKNDVEQIIRRLRPALQMRLRFIAGHGKDETPSSSGPAVGDKLHSFAQIAN